MTFGIPRDGAQWIALFAALLLWIAALLPQPAFLKKRPLFSFSTRAWLLCACACAAALLSALYIHAYLRGGSRIIDATSYMLEARAIARGYFCFPAPDPIASVHGRFLIQNESPEGPCLSVLFPPGYPAFLALFLSAGIPMAAGPVLAAALVIATYDLARQIFWNTEANQSNTHEIHIPLLAAVFSLICAALRYHSADTMSHGLSALCFTLALSFALRATRKTPPNTENTKNQAAIAGFFLGWLIATRPISALACALTIALIAAQSQTRPKIPRHLLPLSLGLLPGLILFLAHQYHATGGQLAHSSQRLYYALADGPPDCFRYGFGKNIGCLQEHGDFVAHNLPNGFDAWAATKTTLRRLKMHLADPANSEPLMLLVLIGLYDLRKNDKYKRAFWVFFAIALQIAAYIPFYFDGNYPGGGARFYADILPLEHILCALALVQLGSKTQKPKQTIALGIALNLLGFSFRTGHEHAQLREREGAQPMFDPKLLPKEAHSEKALVFVDTDHGLNLAYEPEPTLKGYPKIARYRGDILDFWRWEALGSPPAYRYRFDIHKSPPTSTESYIPSPEPVLEGEHLWPAQAQHNAWAIPTWQGPPCLSNQSFMAIHSPPGESGHADLRLPDQLAGRGIAPRIVYIGHAHAQAPQILLLDGQQIIHTWILDTKTPCHTLAPFQIPAQITQLRIRLIQNPQNPSFGLDKIDISPKP